MSADALLSDGMLASGAMTALGITTNTLAGMVLILFLILLMLTEADDWHAKITAVAAKGGDRRWLDIGRSVGEKFRAYFTLRLILGTLTAALYMVWLAIFGVDYLVLWGLLAVLLNFIPTVGSIVAGALPVAYVLVTRDAGMAALVAGGLLVIEQIMGNFIDPKVMGKRLSISPLVVLLSLLFWSLLWGMVGAILAVPMTVLITMVMAHFRELRPAALLLTDQTSFAELDHYIEPNG
ncbi:AI-2E family transporter [Pseudopontixanthobacter vadosimaris]|uniref:AI-2E family transporter n=1 Tax=Pseudopontixanthobacter vadosimaris TaxID=2726450 RepID=UPI0014746E0C|nr:AI-2E family transporter [Pseudopontixanthobacter vadosimaris]